MDDQRKCKTAQSDKRTGISGGLAILARIIAREEIDKQGWGEVKQPGVTLSGLAGQITNPLVKETVFIK